MGTSERAFERFFASLRMTHQLVAQRETIETSFDRGAETLGSAVCQPAVRGSLPRTVSRSEKVLRRSIWRAAKCYRLAACAPQQADHRALLLRSWRRARRGRSARRSVRDGKHPVRL